MELSEKIRILKRGVVELVSEEELVKKLSSGKTLRIKLGVDPTSPDLHLGHTVVLNMLRAFQDVGHHAVLIIGDFTAQVGDPSGRDETRPVLSFKEIEANAKTYQDQAFKVLDRDKTEVVFNSSWLAPIFRVERVIERESVLARFLSQYSVLRLLEREEFSKRREMELPITLGEIFYPLFQAYDSVAVKADVELGGNDQIFNLLMGRQMQKDFGQEPQVVLTLPLLVGTDGTKKMSKTYGNYVALEDSPDEMYGKVMSIPDASMTSYYELLTTEDLKQDVHPMEAKKHLAYVVTAQFHTANASAAAQEHFESVFSRKEIPQKIIEYKMERTPMSLSEVLLKSGMAKSRKDAQRLISQGGVRVNSEKVGKETDISQECLIQVGSRHFRKVIPPK